MEPWISSLRKIFAIENIDKRHIVVVDWFCMRKRGDSLDYLLLHCKSASTLWSDFSGLLVGSELDQKNSRPILFLEKAMQPTKYSSVGNGFYLSHMVYIEGNERKKP